MVTVMVAVKIRPHSLGNKLLNPTPYRVGRRMGKGGGRDDHFPPFGFSPRFLRLIKGKYVAASVGFCAPRL